MRNDYADQDWSEYQRIDRDTQRAVQGIANAVAITLVLVSVVILGFVELSR